MQQFHRFAKIKDVAAWHSPRITSLIIKKCTLVRSLRLVQRSSLHDVEPSAESIPRSSRSIPLGLQKNMFQRGPRQEFLPLLLRSTTQSVPLDSCRGVPCTMWSRQQKTYNVLLDQFHQARVVVETINYNYNCKSNFQILQLLNACGSILLLEALWPNVFTAWESHEIPELRKRQDENNAQNITSPVSLIRLPTLAFPFQGTPHLRQQLLGLMVNMPEQTNAFIPPRRLMGRLSN